MISVRKLQWILHLDLDTPLVRFYSISETTASSRERLQTEVADYECDLGENAKQMQNKVRTRSQASLYAMFDLFVPDLVLALERVAKRALTETGLGHARSRRARKARPRPYAREPDRPFVDSSRLAQSK